MMGYLQSTNAYSQFMSVYWMHSRWACPYLWGPVASPVDTPSQHLADTSSWSCHPSFFLPTVLYAPFSPLHVAGTTHIKPVSFFRLSVPFKCQRETLFLVCIQDSDEAPWASRTPNTCPTYASVCRCWLIDLLVHPTPTGHWWSRVKSQCPCFQEVHKLRGRKTKN